MREISPYVRLSQVLGELADSFANAPAHRIPDPSQRVFLGALMARLAAHAAQMEQMLLDLCATQDGARPTARVVPIEVPGSTVVVPGSTVVVLPFPARRAAAARNTNVTQDHPSQDGA